MRKGKKEKRGKRKRWNRRRQKSGMLLGLDELREAQQGIYLKSPVRNLETVSKSD